MHVASPFTWSDDYVYYSVKMCVLCSGLLCIGFDDYKCVFFVVDNLLSVSNNTIVRSV